MSNEISLSIEETNKLRISLGLKPLKEGKESGTKDQVAQENYIKHQEEEKQKNEDQKILERITKSKEKRESNKKLTGKGIAELERGTVNEEGEEEETELSALEWVKRTKEREQREKEQERTRMREKRKKENKSKNRMDEYSSKNLQGMEVAHSTRDIKEGEEEILTFMDQTIDELEEQGEKLQSVRIAEEKKLAKYLKRKQNKDRMAMLSAYLEGDNESEEEDDEEDMRIGTTLGGSEESKAKKKRRMVLGEGGEVKVEKLEKESESTHGGIKRIKVDMDVDNDAGMGGMGVGRRAETGSEYMSVEEANKKFFNKGKKRGKKSERKNDSGTGKSRGAKQRSATVEEGVNIDAIGGLKGEGKIGKLYGNENGGENDYDDYDNDDDELRRAISKAARQKVEYKLNIDRIANIADVHTGSPTSAMEVENREDGGDGEEDGVIEISAFTEFINRLGGENGDDSEMMMQDEEEEGAHGHELEREHKRANETGEQDEIKGGNNAENSLTTEMEGVEDVSDRKSNSNGTGQDNGGDNEDKIANEPLVGKGITETLKLLKSKGLVTTGPSNSAKKGLLSREGEDSQGYEKMDEKTQWLLMVKKRMMDLKTANANSGGGKKKLEQDYLKLREQLMKDYKPTFVLEYHDEHGNKLNQKQAFKHFAHQFHGIKPGKKKTDKLRKKMESQNQTQN